MHAPCGYMHDKKTKQQAAGCCAEAVQPPLAATQPAEQVSGLGPPFAGTAGFRTEVARPGAGYVGRLLLRLPPAMRWDGGGPTKSPAYVFGGTARSKTKKNDSTGVVT